MFKLRAITIIVRPSLIIRLCSRLSRWVRIDILSLLAGLLTNISPGRAIRPWVTRKCRRTLLEKAAGRLLTWPVGTLILLSYPRVAV